jgi:hypothetical protein
MDYIINLGIYLVICAGILGIVFGGVYLKKKFNIKDSEIELSKTIIDLIVYLANKSEFKVKSDITTVAKYVLLAISIIEEFESTATIEEKKQLISEEALAICEENGIVLDKELIGLVNEIVDYFVH